MSWSSDTQALQPKSVVQFENVALLSGSITASLCATSTTPITLAVNHKQNKKQLLLEDAKIHHKMRDSRGMFSLEQWNYSSRPSQVTSQVRQYRISQRHRTKSISYAKQFSWKSDSPQMSNFCFWELCPVYVRNKEDEDVVWYRCRYKTFTNRNIWWMQWWSRCGTLPAAVLVSKGSE